MPSAAQTQFGCLVTNSMTAACKLDAEVTVTGWLRVEVIGRFGRVLEPVPEETERGQAQFLLLPRLHASPI